MNEYKHQKPRKSGLKANYNGATPEQVAKVLLMKNRAKPVKTKKQTKA